MSSPLDVVDRGDHLLLRVRASPGASRDRIVGLHGTALKVAVAAPPDRGKANAAIARVLSEALGLKAAAVSLERGGTSRDKWYRVEGIGIDDLRRLLERHVAR